MDANYDTSHENFATLHEVKTFIVLHYEAILRLKTMSTFDFEINLGNKWSDLDLLGMAPRIISAFIKPIVLSVLVGLFSHIEITDFVVLADMRI